MQNKIWRNSDSFIKRCLGVCGNGIVAEIILIIPFFIVALWGVVSFIKVNMGL